ncbi:MAG: ThiF family adenylyltransferase, partial [Clostridia bacterium]|nr:ThiF family adenylyltransferase [Clostridia bacterium]
MRTEMLIGEEAFNKLQSAKVGIFGLGGVGSFAAEAIARAGVGEIDLFDGDVVDITNINRQLVALDDTVGRAKTEVMKERIEKINKSAKVSSN